MSELYTNAYASVKGLDKTCAMLDFVERWFFRISGYGSSRDNHWSGYDNPNGARKRILSSALANKGGRVLVLYGQPGDGKTTFCKKAVYAHCKEGWLGKASHVLWLSLNPNDNGRQIISGEEGKLNLERAFCLNGSSNLTDDTYFIQPSTLKGSLIIFDGYDELTESLHGDREANTFWGFFNKVSDLARKYDFNAVITSRKMCIVDDVEGRRSPDEHGNAFAEFAPLEDWQQDSMIDRMIQIDQEYQEHDKVINAESYQYEDEAVEEDEASMSGEGRKNAEPTLAEYRDYVLPELRKKKGEDNSISELIKIPSLFRMIVTHKFRESFGSYAELYKKLSEQLLVYRNSYSIGTVGRRPAARGKVEEGLALGSTEKNDLLSDGCGSNNVSDTMT